MQIHMTEKVIKRNTSKIMSFAQDRIYESLFDFLLLEDKKTITNSNNIKNGSYRKRSARLHGRGAQEA